MILSEFVVQVRMKTRPSGVGPVVGADADSGGRHGSGAVVDAGTRALRQGSYCADEKDGSWVAVRGVVEAEMISFSPCLHGCIKGTDFRRVVST